MQILIVDSKVPELDQVLASLAPGVQHYVYDKTKSETIMEAVKSSLSGEPQSELNLGFMYPGNGYVRVPFFPDVKFEESLTASLAFSVKCFEFLKTLGTLTSSFTLDLISCKEDYDYSQYNSTVDGLIRYSKNKVGSASLGGNYILSTTGTNLVGLYFTDSILSWNHVLDGGTDRSTNLPDGIKYDANKRVYKLTKNIKWTDITYSGSGTASDFITLTTGQVFDGQGHTIRFSPRTFSSGLFKATITVTTTTPAAIIKNLKVETDIVQGDSSVGGGAIIRSGSYGFELHNCKVVGDVLENTCGGLVGDQCNNYVIDKCEFVGDVIGANAGGIVGAKNGFYTKSVTGTGTATETVTQSVTITNSKMRGNIFGASSGGIAGSAFASSSTNFPGSGTISVTLTNTNVVSGNEVHGNVYGTSAAGLLAQALNIGHTGNDSGSGSVIKFTENLSVINNSYHGDLIGDLSSGIIGCTSYTTPGTTGNFGTHTTANINLLVKNCTTNGDIVGRGGAGILGSYSNTNTGVYNSSLSGITIQNSYYKGVIRGATGQIGGIVGTTAGTTLSNGPTFCLPMYITHCSADTTIIGPTSSGILGPYSNYANISNCFTKGNIYNTSAGIYYNDATPVGVTISNSFASGHPDATSFGIAVGSKPTPTAPFYARDLTAAANKLSLIKGSIDLLDPTVWKKVKHDYPEFKHKFAK